MNEVRDCPLTPEIRAETCLALAIEMALWTAFERGVDPERARRVYDDTWGEVERALPGQVAAKAGERMGWR